MAVIRVKADYATIQAAVDAAFPGDAIIVENGVYNEQVTVNKNFIKIIGSGEQTVLDGQMKLNTGFILNNAQGIEIKGFVIKNYRSDGIDFSGSSVYNKIEKVRITNTNYYGIWMNQNSANNLITETSITGSYYGIYNYANNLRIERCNISFNGSTGIYCSGNSANVVIRRNNISKNYNYGIIFYGASAVISENRLNENGSYGIYASGNCLITENEVCKNLSDGIYLSYLSCIVKENRVDANGRNGIYVDGNGFQSVIKNKVRGNTAVGILITSTGNTVLGNEALHNERFDIARLQADNFVQNNICKKSLPPELCKTCGLEDQEILKAENKDFLGEGETPWMV